MVERRDDEEGRDAQADPAIERLLTFLRESRGFDLTGYKRASLSLRIHHQMSRVSMTSVDDYLDYLQVHPDEFANLIDTILINVTGFFRDGESWRHLDAVVLPELLDADGDGPIRIWSAGCASGQEAYSIAMLVAEHVGAQQFHRRVKTYATDVDEDALTIARQAAYTDRELRDVPADLRGKYFEPHGNRFLFRKDLRRNIIFGRNDLIQDAPISRIDLLACRNTLMYFTAETQALIAGRLAFALRTGGVLFLGKAETLLTQSSLFEAIDLRRRLFRKVIATKTNPPERAGVGHHEESYRGAQLRSEAFLASPVAQLGSPTTTGSC